MLSKKQPIDYSNFRINQFNFPDEKKFNFFTWFRRKLIGTQWRLSPTSPRAPLLLLGEAIGFDTIAHKDLLVHHQHRLRLQSRIARIIYWLTSLVLVLPFIAPIVIFFSQNPSATLALLLIIVSALFTLVVGAIATRFSYFVTLRFFSDSMSIQALIYLILDLAHYQNPLTVAQKKQLLSRITFLVKATRSLIYQYDLDPKALDWTKKHLRQLEYYLQERERWIVAPKDSTIEHLRQDFYYLGLVYLSGNLGNFEYETEADEPHKTDDSSTNRIKDFILGTIRFVIGIFAPILGLLIIAWYPERIMNIIDVKVFTLICIGWLLLAVDVVLKLGIVSSVIGIAKGIKELA